jgi:UrcA family protein
MFTKISKPVRVARYAIVLGVAALSFGAGSAQAEQATAVVPTKTVVGYSDLDLSKESDVRSLYERLQRASARVCEQGRDLRNLRLKHLQDTCYQESLARAVDSVGHASVKAIYVADERIRMAGRANKTQARS